MGADLATRVRRAGVVGAGGAGFPTYVKLQSQVEIYIANAAECEPLLEKDQGLIRRHPELVVRGLELAMEATGAQRGVIAIKAKYREAIEALRGHLRGPMEFYYFDNFYPAGDEYIIVYDVTGRLIPPGGLPLDVGCAVNNVETLINLARAAEDVPVTETAITVTGAVREPLSAAVPLGITAREALELAGGATVDEPALLDGGAMMGRVVLDLDTPLTKTSGGFIVVPRDHPVVRRKTQPTEQKVTIAQSACDQCMACTEMCPRFLLGYEIEPHKVMRSVGFAGDKALGWAQLGLQCCECGVCDLYACPEDLPVRDMCIQSKGAWRATGQRPDPLPGRGEAHPMRDARRVPIPRLVERLDLTRWDVHAPWTDRTLSPAAVRLALKQHVGAPGAAVVAVGDRVRRGDVVAEPPQDALGVPVHASIDGIVEQVTDTEIVLRAAR